MKRQAVRGSALRAPAGQIPPVPTRGLAGAFLPVHPDQEAALPLCGTPASEPSCSDTSGQGVRPLETRAQGALLPETPASEPSRSDTSRRRGTPPWNPHSRSLAPRDPSVRALLLRQALWRRGTPPWNPRSGSLAPRDPSIRALLLRHLWPKGSPLGTRAQGVLLPETPAWKAGPPPFPPYPWRCVAFP